jgi:hypothetical protein
MLGRRPIGPLAAKARRCSLAAGFGSGKANLPWSWSWDLPSAEWHRHFGKNSHIIYRNWGIVGKIPKPHSPTVGKFPVNYFRRPAGNNEAAQRAQAQADITPAL